MEILDNVLKDGREGIKQNLHNTLDEFCEVCADELWEVTNEIIRLQSENAALRKRLEKAVELPFLMQDEDEIIVAYKDNDGHIKWCRWIENKSYGEYGNGKEAAEARLQELLK